MHKSCLPKAVCHGPTSIPEVLKQQAMTPNLDKLSKLSAHWMHCAKVDEICEAIRSIKFDEHDTALVLKALFAQSSIAHVFQEAVEAAEDEARCADLLEEEASYSR